MFVGNDIVDLAGPRIRERLFPWAHPRWLERHLTGRERRRLRGDRVAGFWKLFAAKEAAYKALAQAGVPTPDGAYFLLEADPGSARVRHLPTGLCAELLRLEADPEKVHAIAALGPRTPLCWGVDRLLPGRDPSAAVRERLLDALGSDRYAVGSLGSTPRILEGGRWTPWSVSFSHSGRFTAFAWAR